MNFQVQEYSLKYTKNKNINFVKNRILGYDDAGIFLRSYFKNVPIEQIIILSLNNRNVINGFIVLTGETNQCIVHPKTVFRFLLTSAASSFIIAHNHPGGSNNPSEADWAITERLFKIGKDLELPMLDHIIVCENNTVSMRQLSRWPN